MAKALKEYLEVQKRKIMMKEMMKMNKNSGDYPLEFCSSQDFSSTMKRKCNRTFLEDFPKGTCSQIMSPQPVNKSNLTSKIDFGRNS